MTKGSLYERLKKKNGGGGKGKRVLITVNVAGSAGALRFMANEEDLAGEVIRTALKCYAREDRLPHLSSDASDFLLYCANAQTDALSPRERIGSKEVRNFVLYKKQAAAATPLLFPPHKPNPSWKAWLNKSLSFKIIHSH